MKYQLWAVLLLLSFLLYSCSDKQVDGGAIEVVVFGKFLLPDGSAASNMEVELSRLNDTAIDTTWSVRTDEDGYYQFDSVDFGEFQIYADTEIDTTFYFYEENGIFIDSNNSVKVESSYQYDLEVDTLLELGYISGTISLPISDLSGSDIKLLGDSPSATTDSSGRFFLRNVPVGKPYQFRLSHWGYHSVDTILSIAEHGDTVTLGTISLERDAAVPVDPPIGLSATYNKITQEVTLRWNRVDDPILAGYRLFRRLKAGDIDQYDTLSGKNLLRDTTFVDTIWPAQEIEQVFLYQLKSWDTFNNSSVNFSEAVEVSVYPEVPTMPNVPSIPKPGSSFRYADTGIALPFSWIGGPEKMFDTVTYTVLFDTLNPPQDTLMKGIKESDFTHVLPNVATTYYWQVVAQNGEGTTKGPVWNIQTFVPITPMLMRFVPAKDSSFIMGYSGGGATDMTTEHTVSFTNDFYIDSTEVSQASFHARMYHWYANVYQKPRWNNPGDSEDNNSSHPAYNVSWFDAILYCNALSDDNNLDTVYVYDQIKGTLCYGGVTTNLRVDTTANGFRLPTEAEWEYACRAGKRTLYFWGDVFRDEFDHCKWHGNSGATSSNFVNSFKYLNDLLINEFAGNVSEWCHDIYIAGEYDKGAVTNPWGVSGEYSGNHVIRGGNWATKDTSDLMVHRRFYAEATEVSNTVGFRTVLPAPDPWRGE